jgi:hypothetical protein
VDLVVSHRGGHSPMVMLRPASVSSSMNRAAGGGWRRATLTELQQLLDTWCEQHPVTGTDP